jgi:hypothetical protein
MVSEEGERHGAGRGLGWAAYAACGVALAYAALALARHVLVWDLWFVVWGPLPGVAAWAGQSQVVSARG